MKLHIAEDFLSVQGEGHYTGVPMYFLRLAGCSVGKPILTGKRPMNAAPYIEECTLYDGRTFLCDTDFRRKETLSIEEVIDRIPRVNHISITGGEPLNQNFAVKELVDHIRTFIKVHIETSGTIAPEWLFDDDYKDVWVTVSPKKNVIPSMMERANEIKFLVDENFKPEEAEAMLKSMHGHVWLQPVNFENTLDTGNVKRCLDILTKYPLWKLSVQMHKVIGVR